MQLTLINSGGAQVFLIAGAIAYSTAEVLEPAPPRGLRLREVHGKRRADIIMQGFVRIGARIVFDDGRQWTIESTALLTAEYRAEADDGSAGVVMVLDGANRLRIGDTAGELVTGRPHNGPGFFADQQWVVDVDDNLDPFLAAALLAALVALAGGFDYA